MVWYHFMGCSSALIRELGRVFKNYKSPERRRGLPTRSARRVLQARRWPAPLANLCQSRQAHRSSGRHCSVGAPGHESRRLRHSFGADDHRSTSLPKRAPCGSFPVFPWAYSQVLRSSRRGYCQSELGPGSTFWFIRNAPCRLTTGPAARDAGSCRSQTWGSRPQTPQVEPACRWRRALPQTLGASRRPRWSRALGR